MDNFQEINKWASKFSNASGDNQQRNLKNNNMDFMNNPSNSGNFSPATGEMNTQMLSTATAEYMVTLTNTTVSTLTAVLFDANNPASGAELQPGGVTVAVDIPGYSGNASHDYLRNTIKSQPFTYIHARMDVGSLSAQKQKNWTIVQVRGISTTSVNFQIGRYKNPMYQDTTIIDINDAPFLVDGGLKIQIPLVPTGSEAVLLYISISSRMSNSNALINVSPVMDTSSPPARFGEQKMQLQLNQG